MRTINLLFINICIIALSFGQTKEKMVLDGNSEYEKGLELIKEAQSISADSSRQLEADAIMQQAISKFSKAEVNYKKAKEKEQDYLEAEFNLGDALHKQARYEDSRKKFENIISRPNISPQVKSGAHHNIGNSYLEEFLKDPQNKSDKLDQSIESYKNALRANPADNDARYNLEFARKLKQQQQQQQQQQDQNKKDNKEDKEKQDQQQQQDKDKKDKKQKQDQQQQQDKDKKDKEQQQREQKKDEMTKEEAERMLEALKNKEEKLQEKRKEKKGGGRIIIEKDW